MSNGGRNSEDVSRAGPGLDTDEDDHPEIQNLPPEVKASIALSEDPTGTLERWRLEHEPAATRTFIQAEIQKQQVKSSPGRPTYPGDSVGKEFAWQLGVGRYLTAEQFEDITESHYIPSPPRYRPHPLIRTFPFPSDATRLDGWAYCDPELDNAHNPLRRTDRVAKYWLAADPLAQKQGNPLHQASTPGKKMIPGGSTQHIKDSTAIQITAASDSPVDGELKHAPNTSAIQLPSVLKNQRRTGKRVKKRKNAQRGGIHMEPAPPDNSSPSVSVTAEQQRLFPTEYLSASSDVRGAPLTEARVAFDAHNPQPTTSPAPEQMQLLHSPARAPARFYISLPTPRPNQVIWAGARASFFSWKTSKLLFAEVTRYMLYKAIVRPIKSLRLTLKMPWEDGERELSEFILYPGSDQAFQDMYNEFVIMMDRAPKDRRFSIGAHPILEYTDADIEETKEQSYEEHEFVWI